MPRLLARGLALFLFAVLLAAPEALAQQTAPPPQAPPPQAPPQVDIEVTDDELDSFAEAYLDIEDLQATYEQRFGVIEDPAEAQQVQEQFNLEAMQTIESSDIGAERYDEIIRAAQSDPALAQDIVSRVDEMRTDN